MKNLIATVVLLACASGCGEPGFDEALAETQDGYGVDALRQTRCLVGVSEVCTFPRSKRRRVWLDGSCNNSLGGLAYPDLIREAARRAGTALGTGFQYTFDGTAANHAVRVGCVARESLAGYRPQAYACNGVERDEFGNPIAPQQCFVSRGYITFDRVRAVSECAVRGVFGAACAGFGISAFQHEFLHDAGLGHSGTNALMSTQIAATPPWTGPMTPTAFEINAMTNYCAPDVCGF